MFNRLRCVGSIAAAALVMLLGAGVARAQIERQVQIRSLDFDTNIIELYNFSNTDLDLTGWRFCSHDFDQNLRYTGAFGLSGRTIEAGTSFFVHFENDAPGGDPDRINRSALGGSFAEPLDQDAYGMQIFFPMFGVVNFDNSAQIADHIQWNLGGQGAGLAEQRTGQAVSQGLWSAIGDFVATETVTSRVELTDLSGDVFGSPAEYSVGGSTPGEISGLRVGKLGQDAQLSWDADCAGSKSHDVYVGDLAQGYGSIGFVECGVSGTTATVPFGSSAGEFYLVVPVLGGQNGSYGRGSSGVERIPAAVACNPQGSFETCKAP